MWAIWYSLLLLGYKHVQHVTVLNSVGDCNTIVTIIIVYYNIIRLWDHRRIWDPPLTEMSLCGAYLYRLISFLHIFPAAHYTQSHYVVRYHFSVFENRGRGLFLFLITGWCGWAFWVLCIGHVCLTFVKNFCPHIHFDLPDLFSVNWTHKCLFNSNPSITLKESFWSSFVKIASAGAVFNPHAIDAPSPSHNGQCFEILAHKFQ